MGLLALGIVKRQPDFQVGNPAVERNLNLIFVAGIKLPDFLNRKI
jgi:hypothetical protein